MNRGVQSRVLIGSTVTTASMPPARRFPAALDEARRIAANIPKLPELLKWLRY